jgi:hypothetical protein
MVIEFGVDGREAEVSTDGITSMGSEELLEPLDPKIPPPAKASVTFLLQNVQCVDLGIC